MVAPVCPERQVGPDPLVLLDQQDLLDPLERVDPEENKAQEVRLVQLASEVREVKMVQLDPLDFPVKQVELARLEPVVLLALPVPLEKREAPESQDLQELVVNVEPLESVDNPELTDKPESEARQDH